jgi:hypothetical protein
MHAWEASWGLPRSPAPLPRRVQARAAGLRGRVASLESERDVAALKQDYAAAVAAASAASERWRRRLMGWGAQHAWRLLLPPPQRCKRSPSNADPAAKTHLQTQCPKHAKPADLRLTALATALPLLVLYLPMCR